MENKYYTPTIEEFHIGFEIERQTQELIGKEIAFKIESKLIGYDYEINKDTTFEPSTISSKDIMYYELNPNHIERDIRVKCLDREDIESLGWEFKEIEKGMLSDRPVFQFKTYLLNFCKNEYAIWLLITDEDCDYQHFSGKIKNKSELKQLMKQLNIQE